MPLAVVMLLLFACGGTASGGDPSPTSSSEQTEASAFNSAHAQSASGSAIQFAPPAAIEETVLVDESDIKIT